MNDDEPMMSNPPVTAIHLRDWFAGQALAALADCEDTDAETIARACYIIGDALLAYRSAK